MSRIISIDFGEKRTGLAATDPLQIIVTGLTTIPTSELKRFLVDYITEEKVEKIVIGCPQHKDGTYTHIKPNIDALKTWILNQWPNIVVDYADEQFSSVLAKDIILKSGVPKMKRRDKSLVDKVSAVVILQKYLGHI